MDNFTDQEIHENQTDLKHVDDGLSGPTEVDAISGGRSVSPENKTSQTVKIKTLFWIVFFWSSPWWW